MQFPLFFLSVLIKVSVAGASVMEQISINGVNVNFDEPGQVVNNGEVLERIESMSEFVKVIVKGAETLSKNVSLAATRHLLESERLMVDLNAQSRPHLSSDGDVRHESKVACRVGRKDGEQS